jgi:hypothetical protein
MGVKCRSVFYVHVTVTNFFVIKSSRTRSCSKAVYKPVWHKPLLSAQWINSWWWTDELSETCRVSWQNKFVKLVHLVGFITKKNSVAYFDPSTRLWTSLSTTKIELISVVLRVVADFNNSVSTSNKVFVACFSSLLQSEQLNIVVSKDQITFLIQLNRTHSVHHLYLSTVWLTGGVLCLWDSRISLTCILTLRSWNVCGLGREISSCSRMKAFWGALTKFRKATISSDMSICVLAWKN